MDLDGGYGHPTNAASSPATRMFRPFQAIGELYPGLIIWCNTRNREIETSALPAGEVYESRRARELKPCMVVDVDYENESVHVARLCVGIPSDPRKWRRVDTTPQITWVVPDAWIWVGTPAHIPVVLNNTRAMHAHQQAAYSTPPISTRNIESYRAHRRAYLGAQSQMQSSSASMSLGAAGGMYSAGPSTSSFPAISAQPVVVPVGFTEQNPAFPGWWRNPTTGWFWSPAKGLMPPP